MHQLAAKFCQFQATMLVQSAILVVCLLALDHLALRKRARAAVRYGLWLLVLVKLLLPTTLRAPTGVGYWVSVQPELNLPVDPEPAMPMVPFDGPPLCVDQEEVGRVEPHVDAATAPRPSPAVVPAPSTPETASQSQETSSPSDSPPPLKPWANAPTPDRSAASLSWELGLFWGWLVGVVSLLVMLLQRYRQVKRLVATSTPVVEGSACQALDRCHRDLLLRRPVGLRMTDELISPAVCGLWRPVILMPAELLGSLSRSKLQAVFTHELCHIKRGDLWVNLLQSLLQIAYFFNPFLWLANAKIRSLREKAVDEMSLWNLDGDAEAYSDALVDIAELAFSRPRFSLRLLGVVESRNALGDRIRHILSRPFPRSAKLGMLGLATIGVIAAALLPMGQNDGDSVPLPSSYEGAKGSVNHQIKVGPSTFRLRSVARYSREGNPVVRAPDGTELAEPPALPTYPKAAKWMDIATIQWDPGPEAYDLIELRVFDHQTRRDVLATECLNFGYELDGSTLTIYSIGHHLPDSLDIWMRVAHKQEGQQVYTLKPAEGQAVRVHSGTGGARLEIVGIGPGIILHPGEGNSPPHELPNHAVTSVELGFAPSRGMQFEMCAVGKDGQRVFSGDSLPADPAPSKRFHTFPITMAAIHHFELRPFTGRDELFFDDVALPVRSASLDPPPVIRFAVDGKPGAYHDKTMPFAPFEVVVRKNARVLGAARDGTGVYGSSDEPAPGTALILHKPGMRFTRPRAIAYDKDGKVLGSARQGTAGSTFLFQELSCQATEVHAVELHLDYGHFAFKPRFVGICSGDSDALYDKDGNQIGTLAYQMSGGNGNHILVFDFPETDEPIHFFPPWHVHPHNEKAACHISAAPGMNAIDFHDGKQRVMIRFSLEEKFRRKRVFGLGDQEVPLDRFDYTLRYYHGPKQEFLFSFRGPLQPGGPMEEDSGKPYTLTVNRFRGDPGPHERKLHFSLAGPKSLPRDIPLVFYNRSGQRIMVPSAQSYEHRLGNDGVTLDFDVSDIELADIATFGAEIPSQISVSGIKAQFPSGNGPHRKSGAKVLHEFIAARKPGVHDDAELARIRSLAMEFAKQRSACEHLLGVQAGLKGKWPEFVDMGLAIATGKYQGSVGYMVEDGKYIQHVNRREAGRYGKLGVTERLRDLPAMSLSRDQLSELALAIREAENPQLLSNLFAVLRKVDTLLSIEVCKELAMDDQPWVWRKAIRIWNGQEARAKNEGLIERRTSAEDYPEPLQMRMALCRTRLERMDLTTYHEAHKLIPEILTARLLYMRGGFGDLWGWMVSELGREEATGGAIRFLQGITDPSVQKLLFGTGSAHWDPAHTVVLTTRSLNAWYGIDIQGLGTRWRWRHTADGNEILEFRNPTEVLAIVRDVLEWRRRNPHAKPLPLVLKGRVLDPEGKGIAGAEIRVHRSQRTKPCMYIGADSLTLTSKPDGSFVLPNPDRTSDYTLRISADGYEPNDRSAPRLGPTGEYEFGKNGDVELSPK